MIKLFDLCVALSFWFSDRLKKYNGEVLPDRSVKHSILNAEEVCLAFQSLLSLQQLEEIPGVAELLHIEIYDNNPSKE